MPSDYKPPKDKPPPNVSPQNVLKNVYKPRLLYGILRYSLIMIVTRAIDDTLFVQLNIYVADINDSEKKVSAIEGFPLSRMQI